MWYADYDPTAHHSLELRLQYFRQTHQIIRRPLAGTLWSYYDCGRNGPTLLLLPGAPGIAEMAFPYLLAFEAHYRVLAPNYPASVGSLDQLMTGLAALIEAETDQPVHLIGASYSGLVAQYFLSHNHERIATLLIGDTGSPRNERAYLYRALLAVLSRLPRLGLQALLFIIVAEVLKGTTEHHRFWQRYLKAVISSLTLSEFANRLKIMIDMDRHVRLIGPPASWQGPTLLIETADDPLFSHHERRSLRGRYPHAEVHTFYNQGHTTALTRFEEYIGVMRRFLTRYAGK